MAHSVSPLAPRAVPHLPAIDGVELAIAETGIRYKNRPDVLLATLAPGTTVAGCFTLSKSRSAPVDWCVQSLKSGAARAVVINAGNANAFTGKAGVATVTAVAKATAQHLKCKPSEIFQASTGVIGEPLNPAPIVNALPGLIAAAHGDCWANAARAIMTTDTFAKVATATVRYGGRTVTINGFATGKAGSVPKGLKSATDTRLKGFSKGLDGLCLDLAQQVARDGEGAEKLIEIAITGAESDKAAHRIAMSIANSPLVKTAIAGEDANWGRIVMAIGKAGEKAIRDKLRIRIGGIQVAKNGMRDPDYKEAEIMPHMKGREITIEADVGVGRGKAKVWTCDLTHRYIDINGSYRS
jgi:glutamate N-acetyltransferase/amino-acid N-acetyltransferase